MVIRLLFDVIEENSGRVPTVSTTLDLTEVGDTRKLDDDNSVVRVEINTSVVSGKPTEV